MQQSKRKVYFRADAGPEIGYGHFIRSLALADMLKDDFECVFFTQTPTEYQINEAKEVCRLVPLPSDDSKFQLFIDYLKGDEIVVLDNYFYSTDYQKAIKAKGCKLVCIDDMHDNHYVADVVINHGCNKPELFSIEPYTKLCLGLDWALLRKPFLEAIHNIQSREHNQQIEKIVVCFGGSDPLGLTRKYIGQLLKISYLKRIDVIVGNQFDYSGLIDDSRLCFHKNISAQAIADLFFCCDLAIVSASTICIEALACGAKVAAICYVDNQRGFYKYLNNSNFIIGLNDYHNTFNDLLEHLSDLKNVNFLYKKTDRNYIKLFNVL